MDKNNGYMSIRIENEKIIRSFPELNVNPFADRICHVFSSEKDDRMSFEDFVDMLSALGANTPPKVKAEWAFQIFGMLCFLIASEILINPTNYTHCNSLCVSFFVFYRF